MNKYYLRNRRKQLGLTLKDVAKAVGVSESTVSRWESGDISNMRQQKISLMANVLKASPLWVMGYSLTDTDKKMFGKLLEDTTTYVELAQYFFDDELQESKKIISLTNILINELSFCNSTQLKDIIDYVKYIKTKVDDK